MSYILTSAASYAVYPAYCANDLLWTTLGYVPALEQTADDPDSEQPSIGAPPSPTGPAPTCSRPPQRIAVTTSEGETSAFAEFPSYEEAYEASQRQDNRVYALPPLDEEAPPSPPPNGEQPFSACAASPAPGPAPRAQEPIPSPSRLHHPQTGRPLSSILSHFSQRASVSLSSFELPPDDLDVGDEGALMRLSTSSHSLQDPTAAEQAAVERTLAVELEHVEVLVQHAKDEEAVADEVLPVSGGGETFFDTLAHSFANVTINAQGEIDTEQWLEAVESTVSMFELFAKAAAAMLAANIYEGLRRIRARVMAAPGECETLQDLVRGEAKLAKKRRLATDSLEWHVRGLRFFVEAMHASRVRPAEELGDSLARAWEAGYSRYFHWAIRPLFKIVVKLCPARDAFYSRLGPGERATVELDEWLAALDARLTIIERFYEQGRFSSL